jgi:vitamin B12 transporter
MNLKKILLLNILLTSFTFSHASETLNPIVVSNSISPIDIHSSPASMEVFTASDIEERGFANMQELLSSISSINVTTNGGIGQLTSVFTRGTESNHTKIILDGVELNPGTLGLAPIHNISINSIDKIEIIKGSSSALHGANTIGGIINIKTKDNSNSISISSGSWSTNSTSLTQSFNANGLKININATRNESKSIPTKIASLRRHSHNTNNIALGLSKEINDYVFTSRLYSSTGNTQYDNYNSSAILNQDHDDYFYTFGLKKFVNDDIFEIIFKSSQNRIFQNIVVFGTTDHTDTLRDIYDFSYTNVGDNKVQKVGVIYTKEHLSELSYGTRFIAFTNKKEYFYQSELSYPSYRVNYGARHIDHSQFGHFTSGNIGLSVLSDNDVYSFNITRSLRPADATDLYGYGGIPTLKPEESFSYEFGIKRYVNKNTFLRGTVFKTKIKNLIEADINSELYISDSLITGLELRAQTFVHPFKYDIGYTYMIPKDTKNNQPLTKRSKHKLNADLIYKINQDSDFRLNILAEGTRKASAFADLNLGSYYIANANYRTKLDQGTITFSMKNIFDRPYRTSHNFNTLDRSFFATYSLNY